MTVKQRQPLGSRFPALQTGAKIRGEKQFTTVTTWSMRIIMVKKNTSVHFLLKLVMVRIYVSSMLEHH